MQNAPRLIRFLRQLHRRWLLWQLIEHAGIGALIAAGAAILVVIVLLVRGGDALTPAIGLLLIGAAGGTIWSMLHRATLLDAAILADRQLKLSDLLGSAFQSNQHADPAFFSAVIADAEAACARLSPNEVIVRRLAGRAWGAIGIATALVISLATLSSHPTTTQAGSAGGVDGRVRSSFEEPNLLFNNLGASNTRANPPGLLPDQNREASGTDSTARDEDPSHTARDGGRTSRDSLKTGSRTVDSSGASAGSTGATGVPPLHRDATSLTATPQGFDDPGALTSPGGGAVASTGTGSAGTPTGLIGARSRDAESPGGSVADRFPNAEMEQSSARFDVQTIPADYRELARRYFENPVLPDVPNRP